MGNQQYYGIPAHPYSRYLGANIEASQHQYDEEDEEMDHMHELLEALSPQQRHSLTIDDLQHLQRVAHLKRMQEWRAHQQQQQQHAHHVPRAQRVSPRSQAPQSLSQSPQAPPLFVPFMRDREFAHRWASTVALLAQQFPSHIPKLRAAIDEQEKLNLSRSATPTSSHPSPFSFNVDNAFQQQQQQQQPVQQQPAQQQEQWEVSDEEKRFLDHFHQLMAGLRTPTSAKRQQQQQRVHVNVFDSPQRVHKHVRRLCSARYQREEAHNRHHHHHHHRSHYTLGELEQMRRYQLIRKKREEQQRLLQQQQQQQEKVLLQALKQREQQQEEELGTKKPKREPMYLFIPPHDNQPGRFVVNPRYTEYLSEDEEKKGEEAQKVISAQEEEEEEPVQRQEKLVDNEKQEGEEKQQEEQQPHAKSYEDFLSSVPIHELFEQFEKQYSDDEEEENPEELDKMREQTQKKQIPIVNEVPIEKQQQQPEVAPIRAQKLQDIPVTSSSSSQEELPKAQERVIEQKTEEPAQEQQTEQKAEFTALDKKKFGENIVHDAKITRVEESVNDLLKDLLEIGTVISDGPTDEKVIRRLNYLDESLTSQLLILDTIITEDDVIRRRRKQQVIRIQNLIAIVEGYIHKLTHPETPEQQEEEQQPKPQEQEQQPLEQPQQQLQQEREEEVKQEEKIVDAAKVSEEPAKEIQVANAETPVEQKIE